MYIWVPTRLIQWIDKDYYCIPLPSLSHPTIPTNMEQRRNPSPPLRLCCLHWPDEVWERFPTHRSPAPIRPLTGSGIVRSGCWTQGSTPKKWQKYWRVQDETSVNATFSENFFVWQNFRHCAIFSALLSAENWSVIVFCNKVSVDIPYVVITLSLDQRKLKCTSLPALEWWS